MKKLLAALCGLFLLPLAFGQGGRVNDIALGADGRPAGGASVKLCTSAASPGDGSTSATACTPAANMYSDEALATLDSDSIVTADARGNYNYYAFPGYYIEQVCKSGSCIARMINIPAPAYRLNDMRIATQGLMFWDDFRRVDTAVGSIGTPALGTAYSFLGTGGIAAATQTNISNQKWISAAGNVAYAIQHLAENPTRIGMKCSWATGNGGSDEGVCVMGVGPATGVNLATNLALHVIISKSTWTIQVVDTSVFTTVCAGTYAANLATDGTVYSFEVELSNDVVRYNFAGKVGACNDTRFVTKIGKYAFWEHYYASTSVAELVRIEAVWAGATTQGGSSVYENSSGVVIANGEALTNVSGNTRNFFARSSGYNFFNDTGGASLATLTNAGALAVPLTVQAGQFLTTANCSDGTATPADCAAAAAGSVVVSASATSVVVNTTKVTANSQIFLTRDNSLGTKLGVTCNTQSSLTLGTPYVSARTASTSFTITLDVAPTTNPMCISYEVRN